MIRRRRHFSALFHGEKIPANPTSGLGCVKDEIIARGSPASSFIDLNEIGLWAPDAIEARLAHVEGNAVRRGYVRAESWDEWVKMMQRWTNQLDEMKRRGEIISPTMQNHD
jgi:hypothetical protein